MSGAAGGIGALDPAARPRIEAACNFINAEVARLRRRVQMLAIAGFCIAGIAYMVMHAKGIDDPRIPIGFFVLVTFGAVGTARRDLARSYKSVVVRRVVNALGGDLSYSPQSSFTRDDFHRMDLFDRRAERWKSEDEIGGRVNAVSYSLHEVRASYTVQSGKSRREVIIFRGLIVRLDFNKNFSGHTVVLANSQSQILGGLFGESDDRRGKQLVRLENVDFEREFSVYGTNDQEARYILTPKLMELVLRARVVLGADLRMSFLNNSVFVTVPQRVDRFEAKLFGARVTPETVLGDLADVVQLAQRLVQTLDLETRIWTRV